MSVAKIESIQIPKVKQDRKVYVIPSFSSSFDLTAEIKNNGNAKPAIIPAIQRIISIIVFPLNFALSLQPILKFLQCHLPTITQFFLLSCFLRPCVKILLRDFFALDPCETLLIFPSVNFEYLIILFLSFPKIGRTQISACPAHVVNGAGAVFRIGSAADGKIFLTVLTFSDGLFSFDALPQNIINDIINAFWIEHICKSPIFHHFIFDIQFLEAEQLQRIILIFFEMACQSFVDSPLR